MPDKYYLVESGALEHLLRTHFLLTQSLLLFEHLLSHSDRPMFLSARKVCEVLGLDRHQLEQCRKKADDPRPCRQRADDVRCLRADRAYGTLLPPEVAEDPLPDTAVRSALTERD